MLDSTLKIPGFSLIRELGRGGTAVVYLAERSDSKKFALKIFHQPLSPHSDAKRRMLGELKVASTIPSENIVRIHDYLEVAGTDILVMDYIDGSSLTEFQSRLPYILPEISVTVAIELLKVLEQMHENGVVHRDLKPSNVLIESSGKIFLADFGLAKHMDASQHTLTGVILGSPDFMSPEQAQGDIINESSDLFSLASILYFLITGTKPFSKPTPLAVLAAVIRGEFEAPQKRNPKISRALSSILQKGLSLKQKDRYANAKQFRLALETYLKDIGLQNDFSFSKWMVDPHVETMAALQRIAEKLAAKGRAAIYKHHWDEATEIISHLSLVAPDSLVLQEMILDLDRNRRRGFGWVYWSAGLAILFISFFFGWKFTHKVQPIKIAAAVTREQPSEEKIIAQDEISVSAAAPVEPKTSPKPAKVKIPDQVIQVDVPSDVSVRWQGRLIDTKRPFRSKPGVYHLQLTKKGFPPIEQEIEVRDDEPTVIRVN